VRNLKADKRLTVLHLLVEGNSIRSTERITRVHRDTIMRLLVRAGDACRDLLDRTMRNLTLAHLELGEIWTFVQIKQGHIKADRSDALIGDQYLYIAFDQKTKLVPAFAIGKRTTDTTERFMLDLAKRIVRTPDKPPPQISTDGFAAYPGAVDLAFANEVAYGQIIMTFTEGEQIGRYGPPEMVQADRRPGPGVDPYSICTSHVERNNLTIRTFLRRYVLLSLGFSKKLENLETAVALHLAHYNFCWRHGTTHVTPAMEAKVTGEKWNLERLANEAGI